MNKINEAVNEALSKIYKQPVIAGRLEHTGWPVVLSKNGNIIDGGLGGSIRPSTAAILNAAACLNVLLDREHELVFDERLIHEEENIGLQD